MGLLRKQLEDYYTVIIADEYVRVEHPRLKHETVRWSDIREVRLINNDLGPWAPDVWLGIFGSESGCMIPRGAKGYEEVFHILAKYDNFNFENAARSMQSTGNEEFVVWTAAAGSSE